MAKGTKKKKKELTIEEKLEQALVPEEEWPYEVPENWCWVKLGSISSHISDGSHNPPKNSGKGIPLLSATNIHDRIIDFEQTARWITDEEWVLENERTQIELGDVLLTIVATIGRVAVVRTDQPFALQRSVATIKPKIDTLYLSYYLESPYIQTFMNANAKGTAQKGFYLNSLKKLYCAIPPLAEQQRIVDRIDSLFAKLDEAKEKTQAVVDGFEDRKAAILHKAFTGELTKQWRTSKGFSRDSWRIVTVKDVCHDVKVGIVIKPSQYYTDEKSGTPAFRSANVREFHIDDFDWVFLNEQGMEINRRSIVHTGDVLVVRSGNPGTACVVEEQYDGYNAIDILIAVPNQEIITSDFLCSFTNSPMGRKLVAENKRGMALAHFNVSGYSKLIMELPSIPEQEVITTTLSKLLDSEQQAKETAEQVIDQIDTMKKSILARAFRGELGTNDSNDESAIELLKKVL